MISLIGDYACKTDAENQDLKGNYTLLNNQCVFTLPDGKKVDQKNYRVL